jgi:membrane-anchored glycerophosphoryl diester phosphodiesterase (GDPDase)
MLILTPLMLAALVYGILMALRYSLAMPACVVEGLPVGQAIKRSIELSKGSRGRIFVLGLLVGVIQMLLGVLLGFPFIVFAVKHSGQPLPLGWLAMQFLVNFVIRTFIGPIYSAGLTLFYYDQRIRREAFDIEWMMQAAGMTPQTGLATPEQI